METNNNQTEELELVTDLQLAKQDESTVKILQEDDLKTVKDALIKVSSFKRKYTVKRLAVTDIESKDQKERLRAAIADLRTTRTDLDKVRKTKVKPYQETIAFINENYNKAIDVIEEMETPLKQLKKEVDEKIEAKEREAEIALQNRVNDRIKKLIDAGSSFDGAYYSIGSDQFNVPTISLGIVDIQTMTDGIFENVLAQVIDKAAIILEETEKETIRLNEEKRLQQEKEAEEKRVLAEQQLALKAQQEEFKRQQDEFKRQQQELKEAQDLMTKIKHDEEENRKREIEEIRLSKLKERRNQLTSRGLTLNQNNQYARAYTNIVISCSVTKMEDYTNEKWDVALGNIDALIKEQEILKKEDEEKAVIERKEELRKEQERIANKALADKKAQDELDEKNRIEALNKKGDKAIWQDFVSRLKAISYPEVKSNDFHIKVNSVRSFIDALK